MTNHDEKQTDGHRAATTTSWLARAAVAVGCAGALGATLLAMPGCDGGGDDDGPGAGSLYAITAVFVGTEGRTSYLSTFSSLDVESVDVRGGIEFAGNVVSDTFDGSVYVGLAESPEMVRYTPSDEGVLVESGRMSFASKGFTRYPFGSAIANDHRAFAIDSDTLRIVVWDPTEMTILDEIEIDQFALDGFDPEFWTASVYEGRLYVPVRHANWTQGVIHPAVVLAIYDVETLELVGVAEDDRCASGGRPVFTENGDAYVVADGRNWSSQLFAHVKAETIGANCILRIRAGQTDFDTDFLVSTRSLLPNDPGLDDLLPEVATEPLPPVQGEGVAFLQVFDPNLLPADATVATDFAFWGQNAFPHHRIVFGDTPTLTPVTGFSPSVLAWAGDVTEGKVFVCQGTHAGCTVHELDPETNVATPLFTIEGSLSGLRRLR